MSKPVLIRCDFFPGSGAGHLKRSHVIALALEREGLAPILVLDVERVATPVEIAVPVAHVSTARFDAKADGAKVIDLAQRTGASLIVGDSYRITPDWIAALKRVGLKVALIDDHGIGAGADLTVNYTPGARPPDLSDERTVFLSGPSYFITDSQKILADARPPARMIAHAGGTGAFESAVAAYAAAARVARTHGLELTWLCPDTATQGRLEAAGLMAEGDSVIGWQKGCSDLWGNSDIVVGPASTSLYEAIMQGAVPVSFPISATQSAGRAVWIEVGHALHIDADELSDPATVGAMLELAVSHHGRLRAALDSHATALDGQGATRVARAMASLAAGKPIPLSNDVACHHAPRIRACDLRDAVGFLAARNAPQVRALSTNPARMISWPEHVAWWLESTIERFVVMGEAGPEAYFWHAPRRVHGCDYLVGGWFPASDKPAFKAAVRLMDWQLQYCAETYPDHMWVATINKNNQPVIAMNRRFGFEPAGVHARSAATCLFPGTTDTFEVLQRRARL